MAFVILLAVLAAGARVSAEAAEQRVVTLAEEDTLDLSGILRFDPVEVRAQRLKISEIVARCMERERAQQERIRAHNFTRTTKVVLHVGVAGEEADRLLIEESADRVYLRRDGGSSTVPLLRERYRLERGVRKPWEQEDDDVNVNIEADDLESLPFYLEDRGDYEFTIVGRDFLEDRLIYRVHLQPRSDFDIAAEGTIWIDTTEFQILREEFEFGDRVPFPLLVRSIGPVVRERERIGDEWVWKRLLVRIDLKAGWMRFMEKDIPDRVEFLLSFDDHEINDSAAPPPADAKPETGDR